jgi:hypothetical protein
VPGVEDMPLEEAMIPNRTNLRMNAEAAPVTTSDHSGRRWMPHIPLSVRTIAWCAIAVGALTGSRSGDPASARTGRRSISRTSPTRADSGPDDPLFHDVVVAAGLRPLSATTLASGARELRIWIGGGIGWPQDLYQIRSERGTVRGQWIRYWYRDDESQSRSGEVSFSAVVRYSLEGTCESIRAAGDARICLTKFSARPNWERVLKDIQAESVWTLPDESETVNDGVIVTDGYGITVEAREGTRYRFYSYGNPDAHTAPAAQHAAAIARAFRDMWSFLPPHRNQHVFRGHFTGGARRYAFVRCGETTVWGLQGELGPLMPLTPDKMLDTLADTVRQAYVEVRGMKAYPGLAKQWRSPYPEIIEVDSVMAVRPWRAEECG